MDDPLRVRGLERLGDSDPEVQHLLPGQPPRVQQLAQRLALEQLHHDEGPAGVVADVVDRADVRVVEPGGDARLALEPLERPGLGEQVRREHLDRHRALQTQVLGPVDGAHPARAQLLENAVVGERLPDHSRRSAAGRGRHAPLR